MAQPDLTSHHVNYLIWRYLQESGHGDAAVSLQRAWYPDPQTLPFAPYIKTHALVSLVQKGLQYHELQSSLDKEGNHINLSPNDYFFGPEPFETGVVDRRDEVGTDQASPGKVARDHPNGHADPGKQAREDDSMDDDATESKPSTPNLDGDGDISMGEIPEPTFALTNGGSVGVQISPAKAADLTPDTALLDAEDHVTRALWRPKDPTMVVAAGDTFCDLWKLSSSSSPVKKKIVDHKNSSTCVSAVGWDAVGEKLAVATCAEQRGTITMYNVNGEAVDLLPELPRMITGLHWANFSSQLVVVASDNHISELALWDDSRRPDVFPPPQHIESPIFDLAWCGHNQVFASGEGAVYQCEVDSNVRLAKKYAANGPSAAWEFIRCVQTDTHSVAIAASATTNAIWIPTHDILISNAHQETITGIEIRPQPHDQRIVFASFGTDNAVKVWQVDLESKDFSCLHKLRLGESVPALAGCFSPDGYAFSAGGKDSLFIWNVERGGEPMATWTAPSSEVKKEDGMTNGQNGHTESAGYRALSWDADGKRLAYGLDKQMALVNLQR
ncbi:uncharacterized protein N7511_005557 [Penicillium nucicola]|uniref:uncharacterized protein n=1 Tax=Penicillium nucicola TaxID=1850975 RepID=UPI00254563AE|nr:uncharacterized protein N7511_005557 [Penicillium nucicola]KAJ5762175.1 hypothetical protein N7511_005557 [Penicillium nucicola]